MRTAEGISAILNAARIKLLKWRLGVTAPAQDERSLRPPRQRPVVSGEQMFASFGFGRKQAAGLRLFIQFRQLCLLLRIERAVCKQH